MKVDNGAAQQAYASAAYRGAVDPTRAAAQAAGGIADGGASATQSSDSVQISSQSRMRAQALDAVRSAPDTRSKLVMELRSQIKAGTYSIDENKLAQQIAQASAMRP